MGYDHITYEVYCGVPTLTTWLGLRGCVASIQTINTIHSTIQFCFPFCVEETLLKIQPSFFFLFYTIDTTRQVYFAAPFKPEAIQALHRQESHSTTGSESELLLLNVMVQVHKSKILRLGSSTPHTPQHSSNDTRTTLKGQQFKIQ